MGGPREVYVTRGLHDLRRVIPADVAFMRTSGPRQSSSRSPFFFFYSNPPLESKHYLLISLSPSRGQALLIHLTAHLILVVWIAAIIRRLTRFRCILYSFHEPIHMIDYFMNTLNAPIFHGVRRDRRGVTMYLLPDSASTLCKPRPSLILA